MNILWYYKKISKGIILKIRCSKDFKTVLIFQMLLYCKILIFIEFEYILSTHFKKVFSKILTY